MTNEYFKAANEVMELADQCEDSEIISILKVGSSRIFDLARSYKQSELTEDMFEEEVFTGTE